MKAATGTPDTGIRWIWMSCFLSLALHNRLYQVQFRRGRILQSAIARWTKVSSRISEYS